MALSCLLVNSSTKAQSRSAFEADSVFALGQYEEAATAYERVFFFTKNIDKKIQALLNRANCFKKLGLNYEAYRSLVRIENFELNDSIRCVSYYELALNLYLSSYFNDAEKYCAKAASIPINSKEYKNAVLLHALVLNELNNYSQARLKLQDYCVGANVQVNARDSLSNFVNRYYSKDNIPKLKSLKKARRLSKCLPGAGLFYAGKPGKAFANIGFQLLAVGYTAANIYVTNYITAASAGLFMMRSFYTGGVNQLNEVIPKRNYEKTRKFNDNFKSAFIKKLNDYNAL
ncbi:MAG: hypothetical protein JWO32_874 [Bacteroidetes bacterium]|nr:hypothetical protein [Bacteroidota bacterium]